MTHEYICLLRIILDTINFRKHFTKQKTVVTKALSFYSASFLVPLIPLLLPSLSELLLDSNLSTMKWDKSKWCFHKKFMKVSS